LLKNDYDASFNFGEREEEEEDLAEINFAFFFKKKKKSLHVVGEKGGVLKGAGQLRLDQVARLLLLQKRCIRFLHSHGLQGILHGLLGLGTTRVGMLGRGKRGRGIAHTR
jgi:hypothetical protein